MKLLRKFDSKKIFGFKEDTLKRLGLKEVTISKIVNLNYRRNLEKYEKYFEKNKITLVSFKDENYPTKLKNISDKPAYIFIRRKH